MTSRRCYSGLALVTLLVTACGGSIEAREISDRAFERHDALVAVLARPFDPLPGTDFSERHPKGPITQQTKSRDRHGARIHMQTHVSFTLDTSNVDHEGLARLLLLDRRQPHLHASQLERLRKVRDDELSGARLLPAEVCLAAAAVFAKPFDDLLPARWGGASRRAMGTASSSLVLSNSQDGNIFVEIRTLLLLDSAQMMVELTCFEHWDSR